MQRLDTDLTAIKKAKNLIKTFGNDALYTAIINHPELITTLLELGDPEIVNNIKHTAMTYLLASENVSAESLWAMITHGTDPNEQSEFDKRTFLHMLADLEFDIDNFYEYAPRLLDLGADPNIKDCDNRNVLRCLMDSKILTIKNGYMMILHGADINTQNHHGQTLLHILASLSDNLDILTIYLPLLLNLNANPNIEDDDGAKVLDYIMIDIDFSRVKKIAFILALHGAHSNLPNHNDKNILQEIYEATPIIKTNLLLQGFTQECLEDTQFMFHHKNSALLQLELKYQTQYHQSKNEFLNLIIMLATSINDADSPSFFTHLPSEILLYICQFMELNKTHYECMALINAAASQRNKLVDMLKSPGGISAHQRNQEGEIEIRFFKSAEILCRDFNTLKCKLKKNDEKKLGFFDKLWNKELTHSSQQVLDQFRDNYAYPHLTTHLSLFSSPSSQSKLLTRVKQTELYVDYKKIIN